MTSDARYCARVCTILLLGLLLGARPGTAADAGGTCPAAPPSPTAPAVDDLITDLDAATAAAPTTSAEPTWTSTGGAVWTPEERRQIEEAWNRIPPEFRAGITEIRRGPDAPEAAAEYSGGVITIRDGTFEEGGYGPWGPEITLVHELGHHWEDTNAEKFQEFTNTFWREPVDTPGKGLVWTPRNPAGFIARRGRDLELEDKPYARKNPWEDLAVAMEMYRGDPAHLRSTADGRRRYDWLKKHVFNGQEYPPRYEGPKALAPSRELTGSERGVALDLIRNRRSVAETYKDQFYKPNAPGYPFTSAGHDLGSAIGYYMLAPDYLKQTAAGRKRFEWIQKNTGLVPGKYPAEYQK